MSKTQKSSNPEPLGATRASRWTYYLMPEYDDLEDQIDEAIDFFDALDEAREVFESYKRESK